MTKILGIDMGSNSIGWALIEKNVGIIKTGARIFSEGVENLGEGDKEMSKNASRRAARGIRRQIFRRKLRKKHLLKALSKYNMCPLTFDDINVWYTTGNFPDTLAFRNWLKTNPYEKRSLALTEKISLYDLGRILFHLSQRRGYLSNSRSETTDAETIFKGKDGIVGINETLENIDSSTLGDYLYSVLPKEHVSYSGETERARSRYTTRSMYIEEFEKIWDQQSKHHPRLTFDMREELGGNKKDKSKKYKKDGILFFQRPLRTQKFLVGKCTFEPTKTKCPASAVEFELFRSYQFLNNIEINGKRISADHKEVILSAMNSWRKTTPMKFSDVRKLLKKSFENIAFNFKDDDKIPTNWTISNLSKYNFYNKDWSELTEEHVSQIWHILYDFDDRDLLKKYAIEKWNLSEDEAQKISKFNLKTGYANLSKKAILNINPFLEMGYNYSHAVAMGGVKNVFGVLWNNIPDEEKKFIISNVNNFVSENNQGGYIGKLKSFLINEYSMNENSLTKLYHHSANINTLEILDTLPVTKEFDKEINNIRNPIVITSLFELRKIVRSIIAEHGKPDEIHIELSRDLNNSKMKRQEIRFKQKKMEKYNDEVVSKLREIGQTINYNNITKYKLWEECQMTCPYSGKPISIDQLFSGNVQVEHIFPFSRSVDNSFMNKTLCFVEENQKKGNLTPFEYFSKQSPEKWNEFKARILSIFHDSKQFPDRYKKFKRFVSEKLNDDFVSRQLNDTRHMSLAAKGILDKICTRVNVGSGHLTSLLRDQWELNSIINSGSVEKNREDHRHHSIDAIVIACMEPSHVKHVATWNRNERTTELTEFPIPFSDFKNKVAIAVNNVVTSHKIKNKSIVKRNIKYKTKDGIIHINQGISARGQLHDASMYGKRKDVYGNTAFHIRKSLKDLTPAMISQIVDPVIRKLAIERLTERGCQFDQKKNKIILNSKQQEDAFKNAFDVPLYLKNKNGSPVPILKVRIATNSTKAHKLYEDVNLYIKPGNNDHIVVYLDKEGVMKCECINFYQVVERKSKNQPTIQLPEDGEKIVETISKNEMFILGLTNEQILDNKNNIEFLSKHLYRVKKITASESGNPDLCFMHHSDSRSDKNMKTEKENGYIYIKGFGDKKTGWFNFNPVKVNITVNGNLRLEKHDVNEMHLS